MKKLSIILIIAVVLSGCAKSFYDVNNNPNVTTNASVDLVLANALKVTAQQQITNGSYQTVTEWMNYWAPSGSYAINASDGASYKQTTDFAGGIWNNYYRNLEDYAYIERTATASANYFYIGAAKAMKAFVYGQLVDMFNNVPYSEALQGVGNLNPKYDAAKAIYEDLSIQLKAAVVLFKRADAVGSTTQDVLFAGVNSKWIQFCNTLRLRLLMHQSQMVGRGAYIQAEINDIAANTGGYLTADAAVNPGYSNSAGKQNPLYGFCYNTAGTFTQDFWRANKYPITFSLVNNDPRYTRWYAANGSGNYVGNVLGATNNAVGSVASVFGPGLLQSVSQGAILITGSESYFLQAEAGLKGFLAVSQLTAFNNGVAASFNYLSAKYPTIKSVVPPFLDSIIFTIPQSITIYTTQANNQTNYAACSNDAQRLACIIRQKYLAFNTTTPLEAWNDYRRTGYPADMPLSIHPQIDQLPPSIPTRFLYVTNEFNTNAANVPTGINYHTSKIFWMP